MFAFEHRLSSVEEVDDVLKKNVFKISQAEWKKKTLANSLNLRGDVHRSSKRIH